MQQLNSPPIHIILYNPCGLINRYDSSSHCHGLHLLFTLYKSNQHIHSKCTPAHICLNDIPWRAPAWRWWRVASLSGYKNNTTRNSSSALAATQHQHPVPGLRGAASPGQHQHQQATLLLRNTGAEASHPCTTTTITMYPG